MKNFVFQSYFDVRQAPAEPIELHISKDQDIVNNPEAGIVNMIRCGMMALQLLPENSSAGTAFGFSFIQEHTKFL